MWLNFDLFPDSASTLSGDVDRLFFFVMGVTVFFSLLIAGLLIAFVVRFRRRPGRPFGAPVHGSIKLEIAWSVIPLVIALVIFAWGAKVFFALSRPPAGASEYFAVGKQWMWKFQHPEGNREINELHVPVGRTVKLTMTSEDVIHSFYVPAFRVKADVLPGRYTTAWFEATRPGRYHLFCAEYCGAEHSLMGGWVEVMEPSRYEAWLAGARTSQTVTPSGEELFVSRACNTCHRPDTDVRGPRLDGLVRAPGDAPRRPPGARRRDLSARIHPQPDGQDRCRLRARDARLPGAAERGGGARAPALREVARAGGDETGMSSSSHR